MIAGESMSNVYRISVTLTELVDRELLQQALDMVLPKFDGFNLRLRQGVFWYYFEENRQAGTGVCGRKVRFRAAISGRIRTTAICSA